MDVKLVDHTTDPIKTLYTAYRVCYSHKTPQEIYEDIEQGRISREDMENFLKKYLSVGHTSPLQQVWFEFAVSGVSRVLTHQLVRHHVGISFEQQSQRYVRLKKNRMTPKSIIKNPEALKIYNQALDCAHKAYNRLQELGIPNEDARYVLPNAMTSNLKISVNLAELQHICDVRLCTRAQWEIRELVAKMRAEVVKKFPIFGPYLAIKCQPMRLGYCDEPEKAWLECPVGKVRPHKTQVIGDADE